MSSGVRVPSVFAVHTVLDDNDKSKDFKQFQANPRELQPTPLADGYFKLAPVAVASGSFLKKSRERYRS